MELRNGSMTCEYICVPPPPHDWKKKIPNSRTVTRPHEGWLELSKPFIAAFKAGATSVNKYIDEDLLIYWYRPTLRDTNCDSTDTCMVPANNDSGNYFLGRPNGWETMQDSVFVVSLLTAPALIQIDSGGTLFSYNAPAGALAQAIPMHIGTQSFSMIRHGKAILSGSSLKPIISECVCGLYNFNAFGEFSSIPIQLASSWDASV